MRDNRDARWTSLLLGLVTTWNGEGLIISIKARQKTPNDTAGSRPRGRKAKGNGKGEPSKP